MKGRKQGSVTYSTDQESKVTKNDFYLNVQNGFNSKAKWVNLKSLLSEPLLFYMHKSDLKIKNS